VEERKNMKGKIIVLLVGMALLVGILSGCTEQEPEPTANTKPEASFTFVVDGATKTVTFTDASLDADGDTLTYLWDFGDGVVATEANDQSPVHVYAENNTYEVTLTVNDGTEDGTVTKTVSVNPVIVANEAPTANFTYAADNLTVTFTDTSTDDSAIAEWLWTFDSDGTAENTTQSPVYTYAAAGTYNVTLTVTDDDADEPLTDTKTVEITVTAAEATE